MNKLIIERKYNIMAKNEKTSSKVAAIASKLLSNPKTPLDIKRVAASALTQAPDKRKKK
jgi:hypothetical protein